MLATQIPFHAQPTLPRDVLARSRVPSESRLSRLQQFIAQKSPTLGALTSRVPKGLGLSGFENHIQYDNSVIRTGYPNVGISQPEFLEASMPPTYPEQFQFPGSIATGALPPQATPSGKRIGWIRSLVPERLRTPQACERCRERKTKCTGTRPTCKRCLKSGAVCVYVLDHKNNRIKAKKTKLRGAEAYAYSVPDAVYGYAGEPMPSMSEIMSAQAALPLVHDAYNLSQVSPYSFPQAAAPSLEVHGAALPQPPAPAYFDVNPFEAGFSRSSSGPALGQAGAGRTQWSRPGYSRHSSSNSSSRSRHNSSSRSQQGSSRPRSTWTMKPSSAWGSSPSFVLLEAERSVSNGSNGPVECLTFAPSSANAGQNAVVVSETQAVSSLQVPDASREFLSSSSSVQGASPTAFDELEAERALAEELERELAAIGVDDGDQDALFLPIPSNLSALSSNGTTSGMDLLAVPPWSYACAQPNAGMLNAGVSLIAQPHAESNPDGFLGPIFQPDQELPMDRDFFPTAPSFTSSEASIPSESATIPQGPLPGFMEAALQECMAKFPMPVIALDVDYLHPDGWMLPAEAQTDCSEASNTGTAAEIPPSNSLKALWVEIFGSEPDA
ncbi:hypothetical protein SCP_0400870 [Sparassis crispa]|uniref:Zn(2)-C6 fungal-type domain-containing protein n=1 Tax=Sparassis crispa TaxID=139825 RepID=A0A401GHQ1_9APHY|nr:hypothetical protein SCP_0400870 [Sparassis crispa]GBE81716.1 hypothetical protein SCP_0400870 [Sparassis crispa]